MSETANSKGMVADAVRGHWVDQYAPEWLRPYARLARWERPIGWWLLLLPCWWSVAISAEMAGAMPNLWHMLLFMIGAIAMRGAGCTYNDLVDQDIDAQVARTRSRPLPSGQITRRQAQIFLIAQALTGFVVLIQFNTFTILLGIASLPVVAIYPFMKRVTNWPQSVLGLAFSWGALMGYAAVFGNLSSPVPFVLYVAALFWTMGYDTIYAHQDQEDDALIGVRSTARTFGEKSRQMIALLFTCALVFAMAAVVIAKASLFAYLGLAAFAGHLAWQISTMKPDDSAHCLAQFRSNKTAGLLLFLGLALSAMISNLVPVT